MQQAAGRSPATRRFCWLASCNFGGIGPGAEPLGGRDRYYGCLVYGNRAV